MEQIYPKGCFCLPTSRVSPFTGVLFVIPLTKRVGDNFLALAAKVVFTVSMVFYKRKDIRIFLNGFKLEEEPGKEYSILPDLQVMYEEIMLPQLQEKLKAFFKKKGWE